jgi:hypothetical protein
MNQIELKYIYHIEQFIVYLFGEKNEYDPEQRIYNKLLRLQGEELETWMNVKLKRFIIGEGLLNEFQGDEFEGVQGRIIFISWYFLRENWRGRKNTLLHLNNIYYNDGKYLEQELNEIKEKLIKHDYKGTYYISWELEMMNDYLKMFIMAMSSEELKSYIIQQVEPIEIK